MKIEDTVYSLNKYLEMSRRSNNVDPNICGQFVLQKSLVPSEISKAYKTVTYTLWYIHKKIKFKCIDIPITDRALTGHEDALYNKVNNSFLILVYDFVKSESFDKIVKGDYEQYTNE